MNARTVLVARRLGMVLPSDLFRHVPRAMAVGFSLLFALCWLLSIGAILDSRSGNPERRDGQYVLNIHGSYTVVSEDTYHHAEALLLRGFSLIPAVFYGLAVLANVALAGVSGPTPGAGVRGERTDHDKPLPT